MVRGQWRCETVCVNEHVEHHVRSFAMSCADEGPPASTTRAPSIQDLQIIRGKGLGHALNSTVMIAAEAAQQRS